EEPTTELLIVALGNTYPIKEELKSLGFRWNAVNKVWYRLGEVTDLHCGFFTDIAGRDVKPGVHFRCFELEETRWREI
ncbi:unnamed protein product, partial [marine sediment metagenome]